MNPEDAAAFRSMIALLRAANAGRLDDVNSLLDSDNIRDVAGKLAEHVLQMYTLLAEHSDLAADSVTDWIDGTLSLTLSMHLIDDEPETY